MGISLAVTGFTFLEAGVRAELPFDGGDQFVMIDAYEEPRGRRGGVTTERFRLLRDHVPALQHVGALENASQNLLLPSGELVLVAGIAISGDSFAFLPYTPTLGRALTGGDSAPGANPVATIRESLWRRHFSADPGVTGRRASFSGVSREIVGVMPDTLEFPNAPEVWIPLSDTQNARIFGILTDTDTLAVAQQQLTVTSRQFDQSHTHEAPVRLHVLPFIDAQSQGLDLLASAVLIVLILVLTVISSNVANLVFARTVARSSELAVRSALGATRARLVSQVFTEVVVLGALAAAIGTFASRRTIAWIESTMTDMPYWLDLDVSSGTVAFIAAVTVLAAAIGGAWPAWRVTRRDPLQVLAASSRRVASGLGHGATLMIGLQIASSIAALYAALVVARGVSGYLSGIASPRESQIITARLVLPDDPTALSTLSRAIDTVRRVHGVEKAGLATSLPRLSPPTRFVAVRAESDSAAPAPRSAPVVAVSPRFIETLGARAIDGRTFDANDLLDNAPPVAMVNAPFVTKFFGGGNAIGREIHVLDADPTDALPVWRQIVGVVPDLGLSLGDEQLAGGVYIPLRARSFLYLAAAVDGDAVVVGRTLPRVLASVHPGIQVRELRRLPEVGHEDRAVFAGIGAALTSLGGIALLLSVMGVYAMLSFAVTARTREIAIRCALGASPGQVLRTVLGRAALPLLCGAVAGPILGKALVAARGIFAFRLPAEGGPWALPLLIFIVAAAAVVAMFNPARRVLSQSTADALRAERGM